MTDTADKEAIERVKYRYLRALDTKDWDSFADTLTDDVTGDYGDRLHFTNRSELVDYMRSSIGPGIITEHRVTHPEITVDGDDASAVWYLQDRVIVAEFNFMLIGAAFRSSASANTSVPILPPTSAPCWPAARRSTASR